MKHRFIVIYSLQVIEPSIGLKNTEEAYFWLLFDCGEVDPTPT